MAARALTPPPWEGRRKAIHAATGVAALWVAVCGEPIATSGLAAVATLALALDAARARSARVQAMVANRLPGVYRPDERGRVSGASLLALGYALTSLACEGRPAAAGILALALGDVAAAVGGRAWTRRTGRAGAGKTLAGSGACFLVASLAVALVLGGSWPVALAGGLAAAVSERLAPGRWDNVAVPLATGVVVQALVGRGIG